jgi:hypothetical protein
VVKTRCSGGRRVFIVLAVAGTIVSAIAAARLKRRCGANPVAERRRDAAIGLEQRGVFDERRARSSGALLANSSTRTSDAMIRSSSTCPISSASSTASDQRRQLARTIGADRRSTLSRSVRSSCF